jgi:hypothetical protein
MDITELKGAQNNYGKISTIHSSSDRLYVGTTDGHVKKNNNIKLMAYKIEKNLKENGETFYSALNINTISLGKTKPVIDLKTDEELKVLFVNFSKTINKKRWTN